VTIEAAEHIQNGDHERGDTCLTAVRKFAGARLVAVLSHSSEESLIVRGDHCLSMYEGKGGSEEEVCLMDPTERMSEEVAAGRDTPTEILAQRSSMKGRRQGKTGESS